MRGMILLAASMLFALGFATGAAIALYGAS